ncbi:hypothetical protein AB0C84_21240 [Actinomadura sp. NPDC048955]|uniref:hypothetical protein n=1 Tax=Actinomadura TaxID=1988 RepID=UPI002164195C|nr:hypothetical protein [Actinomadura glauciflava]MCR3743629.1 hypothetical protein [Actinomadura glauciflava]
MAKDGKITRRELGLAAAAGVILAVTRDCDGDDQRGPGGTEETPDSGQNTQQQPTN